MKCRELVQYFNNICPPEYACSWDNVGLLVGRQEQEVHKVCIALDATKKAVLHAINEGADFILTHHPIIFRGIKSVSDFDFQGDKLLLLAKHDISCFAMHTNYDIIGGMAVIAAEKIGLKKTEPFEVTCERDGKREGIGRVGMISPMNIYELSNLIKRQFEIENLIIYGENLERKVQNIAISPGSGRDMIELAAKKGVELLITGDIGHHEGLDAVEMGMTVIDAGHYGLEHIFMEHMHQKIKNDLGQKIEVITYFEGCPYKVL